MAKGENIFRRRDGRWEARYSKGRELSGKIKYGYCYGKTYREAKEKAEKCKAALASGNPLPTSKTQNLFSAYCMGWLHAKKSKVKESTYIKYSTVVEKHIIPKLGDCCPLGFTTELMDDFIKELQFEDELAPKTVHDILVVLHGILKFTASKVTGTFPVVEINYPKIGKKEMRVLSREEQERFISYLQKDLDPCRFGMGMTKAVMEKNVIARSRQMLPGDPVLCLTRYGNVMASRGSVIPLFCDRIDEGKPLTITNPNMTRFMMTLSDAVDLVLYAFEHGEQGDLFVQKAPAATIETLAQAVLELKHSDLGTTIIGTRHGEKLFEVLVTAEEMMRAEDLPGFFRIPADNRDLNYDNYFSKGNPEFGKIEQYTSHNTHRLNVEEMKQLLLKLKLFGGTC